jgi:hypothetical protein
MLSEAHRTLRPGAWLLVSTPNVTRWANVLALIDGRNIYDRYHGNGMYGRHNREYTLAEVVALVEACGFSVTRAATRDVYPPTLAGGPVGHGREDTIFVLAQATGARREAHPESLYVLMDEYRLVTRSAITMGSNESGHLGRGWYPPEQDAGLGCRWTLEAADFFLKPPAAPRELAVELCAHHPDLATNPLPVTLEIEGAVVSQALLRDHGWQTLRVPLSGTRAAGGAVHGRLRVGRTWTPAEFGGEDRRRLGVRVSTIEMR